MDELEIGRWSRAMAVACGGWLVARAIFSRTAPSLLFAAAGAEMIRFGITGHALFATRNGNSRQTTDVVDLGSELSFPASDPPAY